MRESMRRWAWAVLWLAAGLTAHAYTYNDTANGLWSANTTWQSSDGGTTYPQAGDTAIIDSHVVDVNIANPAGTIYLNTNGTLRVYTVHVANSVQAALHLNGGVFFLDASHGYGTGWYNSTSNAQIMVDSDSTITNGLYGGGIGAAGAASTVQMSGGGTLTYCNVAGYLFAVNATSSNSTYTGTWRIVHGYVTLAGASPSAGTGGWVSNNVDLVSTDSTALMGNGGWGAPQYYHGTLTGRGTVTLASGNGNQLHFASGAMFSPGASGTDEAWSNRVNLSSQEGVYFDSNSEYRANITNATSADKIYVSGGAAVTINAGARLTVKLGAPGNSIPSLSVDILGLSGTLTGSFGTTNWLNTDNWSNLAVNYDRTGSTRRIYITGTYTSPLPSYAPSVDNANGATNILDTSAYLNGTLTDTGNIPTSVWVFWDTSDKQMNKTWTCSHFFDVQSTNLLSWQATNLAPNTWYWYAYYASNSAGDAWGQPSKSFKTGGPPGVDNAGGATLITPTTATLNGNLTNGTSAHVFIAWGTDSGNFANTNDLGTKAEGPFSSGIGGLSSGTLYWYRCLATNAYGAVWAESATSFLTTVPHTYNDKTNGVWSDPNTWLSSDGGTNYPEVGDTAIIDSHTVNVTIANPAGTIYLMTGGVMRVGNNTLGGCSAAQATLHLAGGVLDMWAGSGYGCAWANPATNLDVIVDADSVITNSSLGSGGGIGGVTDATAVRLTGAGVLSVYINYVVGSGAGMGMNVTSDSSTFTGSYRHASAGVLSFPNPALSGTAGWRGSDFDLVATNSALQLSRTGGTWQPYIRKTITGNGRIGVAGAGYGNMDPHMDSGGVLAPGRPNTDEAGIITVAMSAAETFHFESNSEYRVNVVATNLADLVATGPSPVRINPGTRLTVKMWTPTNDVPDLSADILTTTNLVTTNVFDVMWLNTNRWSNLQVNYERAADPRRVYVTGTYTKPPPAGTLFLIR